MGRVARIVRVAEVADEGTAAVGEFVQVGFADNDRACFAKVRDERGIPQGDKLRENLRTGGGARATRPDVVFQCDADAVQRATPFAAGDFTFGRTRLASMACPAMPTCGLALAESERALPGILTGLEGLLAELGISEEEIIVRATGCPNGCARPTFLPFLAQVSVGGRACSAWRH